MLMKNRWQQRHQWCVESSKDDTTRERGEHEVKRRRAHPRGSLPAITCPPPRIIVCWGPTARWNLPLDLTLPPLPPQSTGPIAREDDVAIGGNWVEDPWSHLDSREEWDQPMVGTHQVAWAYIHGTLWGQGKVKMLVVSWAGRVPRIMSRDHPKMSINIPSHVFRNGRNRQTSITHINELPFVLQNLVLKQATRLIRREVMLLHQDKNSI